MTLVIALRCADGLVMVSDSRMSAGSRQSADISQKFLQVNRDVGIMTYGLADPGYRGIRLLVEVVHADPSTFSTMKSIIDSAQQLFPTVHKQFLDSLRQEDGALPPGIEQESVGYVMGGYDGNDTAQFRIHSCSSPDFQFHELSGATLTFAQWPLARWLLQHLEYPGMSVSHGLAIAVMVMIIVSTFEDSVGGPIHIATVMLEQGFSLLNEREVAHLVETVQPSLLALRGAWQEAWQVGMEASMPQPSFGGAFPIEDGR